MTSPMTNPVRGGLPEQGLRDALLNVAEFVYPDGSCCWCNAHELVQHATVYDPAGHHIYCVEARAALGRPRPALPRLDLSGISEEEWGMLAEMKPPALRAALTMLAKAQANGDA